MVASEEHQRPGGADTALVSKIENFALLSDDDRLALNALAEGAREMGARRNILREGERPDHVHLMVEGWAARYKLLPDGGRQITAFLIPGDFCDLHVTLLNEMDHGIVTVTRSKVAYVPKTRMDELTERPTLIKAFWWSTLVDEAVLRSWIVSVGRRDAYEAIGHLICELYVRMKNIGQVTDHRFEVPLTQEDIGDALGLTSVHVNRVLQRMRAEETISFRKGVVTIHDYRRLEKVTGFNGNYLHMDRRRNGPISISQ